MNEPSLTQFADDLIGLLGDDLLCIATRPPRWLSPPTSEEGVVILVWDATLPRSQQLLRRYLAGNPAQRIQADLVGYNQFEESILQGVPASIFAAARGTTRYDPKSVFDRLRRLVVDSDSSVNQTQLVLFLQQKGRDHLRNALITLQRTFAELFLGAEAGLQCRWLRQRSKTTRRDLLSVATWDGLRQELNLAVLDRELEEQLQAIIDSATALQAGEIEPRYGGDIITACGYLQRALDKDLSWREG